MKYNYHGKILALDDKMVDRYEEMNGGFSDLDMDIFLDNEKIQYPDFSMEKLTERELSAVIEKQMIR